jgi:hypothetical protein
LLFRWKKWSSSRNLSRKINGPREKADFTA